MIETLDLRPDAAVEEAEFHRLLGYPRGHQLTDRARELAAWARQWFAEHGRPWVYLREAKLELANDPLRVDGVEFRSRQLHEHLTRAGATRAMFVVASAGSAAEEHARELWEAGKPDEYFFLEMFGSAVVERLVATASGRICELADRDGLMAVPHYSPGYSGWDVADQPKLFELISRGVNHAWPEPLEVLPSGMPRPKKSLLGVFGLAPKSESGRAALRAAPCENCALSPCRYRRAAYRYATAGKAPLNGHASAPAAANYTVNPRALAKWARERVRIEERDDGAIAATFRFDGTTCSNMGQPLAFDYCVTLGTADEGFPIRESDCRPSPDDEGHKKMCAYLSDAPTLMQAIATEKPLLGRPLGDVLSWTRPPAPAGCHCEAASRAHKWGLALEAIHFALAQSGTGVSPVILRRDAAATSEATIPTPEPIPTSS